MSAAHSVRSGMYWKNAWYSPFQCRSPCGSLIHPAAGVKWKAGRMGSDPAHDLADAGGGKLGHAVLVGEAVGLLHRVGELRVDPAGERGAGVQGREDPGQVAVEVGRR